MNEIPPNAAGQAGGPLPAQHASIAFLMFADRAEVLLGKLYVMGGLIDGFVVAQVPAPVVFSLALAIDVPWSAANEQLDVAVLFEDNDGKEVARVAFGLTVGRPPTLARGSTQRVPFAIAQLNFIAPATGDYVARSLINTVEGPRLPFRVMQLGR